MWHEGCSFLIPALGNKVVGYDPEQASHFLFPGYRIPASCMCHLGKMSSVLWGKQPILEV